MKNKNKKTPPNIHPRNKCAKFQSNPTIFGLSRLPCKFSCQFGPWGPKMKNFQKKKKQTNKKTKKPRYNTQGTSVPEFSQIQPFLGSVGCPKFSS